MIPIQDTQRNYQHRLPRKLTAVCQWNAWVVDARVIWHAVASLEGDWGGLPQVPQPMIRKWSSGDITQVSTEQSSMLHLAADILCSLPLCQNGHKSQHSEAISDGAMTHQHHHITAKLLQGAALYIYAPYTTKPCNLGLPLPCSLGLPLPATPAA